VVLQLYDDGIADEITQDELYDKLTNHTIYDKVFDDKAINADTIIYNDTNNIYNFKNN
jgi:hypothetical protein